LPLIHIFSFNLKIFFVERNTENHRGRNERLCRPRKYNIRHCDERTEKNGEEENEYT
jgi:hypothetical protein